MSNALAIAAVTATLQGVISREGILVSTQSLDRAAQDAAGGNRVNLFLYHTMPNSQWRNLDIPQQTRAGETGHPPLAVNLYYLLTAYGTDGSELAAHQVLGRAMRALHDRPILFREDIRNTTQTIAALRDADLDQQVEKVRITPDPLSLEDLSRLWTTFQTQYRVSASYQASVVLIESRRETRAPLPVLTRGVNDRGVRVSLMGFGPELERIHYREQAGDPELPAAAIGNSITLVGKHLPPVENIRLIIRDPKKEQLAGGTDEVVRIPTDPTDASVRALQIVRTSATELKVTLPKFFDPPGNTVPVPWTAGLLSLELQFPRSDAPAPDPDGLPLRESETHESTNTLPLTIAPQLRLQDDGTKVLIGRATQNGKSMLDVSCAFPLGDRRRVYLILSGDTMSYQLPQVRDDIGTGQLTPRFDISNVQPGKYWLRLRVDGVDSLIMESDGGGFKFDDRFEVTL